jgi:hypothetical protein
VSGDFRARIGDSRRGRLAGQQAVERHADRLAPRRARELAEAAGMHPRGVDSRFEQGGHRLPLDGDHAPRREPIHVGMEAQLAGPDLGDPVDDVDRDGARERDGAGARGVGLEGVERAGRERRSRVSMHGARERDGVGVGHPHTSVRRRGAQ